MEYYKDTLNYWQRVFSETIDFDPFQRIKVDDLEEGLDWLVSKESRILDFGCANGRVVLRCIDKGSSYVKGIDICSNAIETAARTAAKHNLQDRSSFICSGVESLKEIEECSYDGVILFNIIDNLIPEHALEVVEEVYRILRPGGRVLLKLNPYIPEKLREEYGFEELSREFYRENTGLYLWNLSEDKIREILAPWFEIEVSREVYYRQYDMINRMYYLRKSDNQGKEVKAGTL